MIDAAAARVVLSAVLVVIGVGLAMQLCGDGPVWAAVTCVCIMIMFLVVGVLRIRPAARRLVTSPDSLDVQLPIVRRLLGYHVMGMAMMAAIVAIQPAVERGTVSTTIAAGGAGFLAATLWNEVLVDRPAARLDAVLTERDRSTVVGYYTVMTATAVRPNLAAVSLAVSVTLGVLLTQLLGSGIPDWAAPTSLAILMVFLVLAGLRTWPAAVRLGGNTEPAEVQMRSARTLGRYHLTFVIMLAAIVVVQLIAS
ncbi:hypothetical protein K7711_43650 [Nocardia sp. CA2R105]|uniref:hypothetical protein n=1 Tax=Nocardia coffeae TaxID=2873381 RepID=UPI001CA69F2F|nr:hypothetical protein [Nocardia coffeae]MBY8863427.1 hypothetical protein [Nocardia coffeae]